MRDNIEQQLAGADDGVIYTPFVETEEYEMWFENLIEPAYDEGVASQEHVDSRSKDQFDTTAAAVWR